MQYEIIQDKHRKWLKENLNLEFEKIDDLDYDERERLACTLMLAEADALEAGDNELLDFICEVIDIIFDKKPDEE